MKPHIQNKWPEKKISEFERLSTVTASMPQTNYNLKNDIEKQAFKNEIHYTEGWNSCHEAFMSIISKQPEALLPFEYVKLADFIRENLTQEDIENISCNDWSGLSLSVKICSKFGQQRVEIDEKSLREYLWMSHGHTGMYGDDGEMQCAECCKYGCSDYKRKPLNKIIETIIIARRDMNIAKFSLLKPAEQQFKSVDEIYNFLRKEQTEIFTKSKPKTNHLLIYAKAIFDRLYGAEPVISVEEIRKPLENILYDFLVKYMPECDCDQSPDYGLNCPVPKWNQQEDLALDKIARAIFDILYGKDKK